MNNELITYIDGIIELEKTGMIQTKVIDSIKEKTAKLGKQKQFHDPAKNRTVYPSYYSEILSAEEDCRSVGFKFSTYIKIGFGCAVGFTIICAIISSILGNEVTFRTNFNNFVRGLLLGFVVQLIIYIIRNVIVDRKYKKKISKANEKIVQTYQENEKKYTQKVKDYEKSICEDKIRVENEKRQITVLNQIMQKVTKKNQETIQQLNKFYNTADVYVIYRNIIAMCYIYEYLKSGICTELTGANGAYNTYKKEEYEKVQKNGSILSQLDKGGFDAVKLNDTIQEINTTVSDLLKGIDRVKEQQLSLFNVENNITDDQEQKIISDICNQNQIIAYNSECTKRELERLRWLENQKFFTASN